LQECWLGCIITQPYRCLSRKLVTVWILHTRILDASCVLCARFSCRALTKAADEGLLTSGFFWIPSLGGPSSMAAQKAVRLHTPNSRS
jgi:hypothetical protein